MNPAAATVENPAGASPYVLLCEHASNFIPPEYAALGLGAAELERHIAWDIGAAPLARHLSRTLDAPLFLSGYSRLLIDCNRPLHSTTSIPDRSEDTVIPGNLGLPAAERARRAAAYFAPLARMVAAELDRRASLAIPTIVLGVHSFTRVFHGVARPWHAGVLYAGAAPFGHALVGLLASIPGTVVGDNEPYRIDPAHDYTVPTHGDGRGLPAALLEIRNDLIADDEGVALWGERLTAVLPGLVGHARPGRA